MARESATESKKEKRKINAGIVRATAVSEKWEKKILWREIKSKVETRRPIIETISDPDEKETLKNNITIIVSNRLTRIYKSRKP